MGYARLSMTIGGLLDAHGGDQETADAATWNRFIAEVKALAAWPDYAKIIPDWGIEADQAWMPEEGEDDE